MRQIERDKSGQCVIEDDSSTEGTYVNGERISAPCPLAVNDEIELGSTSTPARPGSRPPGGDPLLARLAGRWTAAASA